MSYQRSLKINVEDWSNLLAGRVVISLWISHRQADQKFIDKAKGSNFKWDQFEVLLPSETSKTFPEVWVVPLLDISCYRILCLCLMLFTFLLYQHPCYPKMPCFGFIFKKIPFCLLPWPLSVSNHCGLAGSWSLGWITTPEKSTSFQHALSGFYTAHGALAFSWLTPG